MQAMQYRARCSRVAVHNRLQGCDMKQMMLVRKHISSRFIALAATADCYASGCKCSSGCGMCCRGCHVCGCRCRAPVPQAAPVPGRAPAAGQAAAGQPQPCTPGAVAAVPVTAAGAGASTAGTQPRTHTRTRWPRCRRRWVSWSPFMCISALADFSFLEGSTRAASPGRRGFLASQPPTPPPQPEPHMLQICEPWQSKLTSFRGCQGAALCCTMQVLLQGQQVPGVQCGMSCIQWQYVHMQQVPHGFCRCCPKTKQVRPGPCSRRSCRCRREEPQQQQRQQRDQQRCP